MLEQLIQNDGRIRVMPELDPDAHAFAVGLIVDIHNTVDLLVLCKIGNVFDQICLVHKIRQLCDDNLALAVRQRLNAGYGADNNLAFSGRVRFAHTVHTHDDAAGREIRSLDGRHDFVDCGISVFANPVVDHQRAGSYDFPQIVRRNVCCHADRDTGRAVNQKIWKAGGQYRRLFFGFIKVRDKIHGIFIDVRKKLRRDLCHSGFGITHGSRAVAVDRAEVAVSVYQTVAHVPVLRHVNQRAVDGTVAVRMVFTHCITDDTRALTMRFVGRIAKFAHRPENSSLYGLQAVPDIRKGARSNNAHRVVDVRLLHGFVQVDIMNSVKSVVFHSLNSRVYVSKLYTKCYCLKTSVFT